MRAIHLCGPKIYRFEGVEFEVHSYFGPCPLKYNGEPKQRIPRLFWSLWDRFKLLPPDEQAKYRVQ